MKQSIATSIAVNNPRSSYFIGGAEMVSIEHAKKLVAIGLQVAFYTINPESIGESYSDQYLVFKNQFKGRIRFFELNQDSRSLYIYKIQPGEDRSRWNIEALFYSRQLSSYLAKYKKHYDAMISYFNLDALSVHGDNVGSNIIYLCGIPRDESVFRSGFLAMYDRVIAITDETKNYWQKYTNTNIDVVPTGVDCERFTPREHNTEKIKILFMGRLIARKGCHILLSAISKLPDEFLSKSEVVIVGTGPQEMLLSCQIKDYGLSKCVKLIGSVNNPELYLSEADICVLPSLNGEGLQGVLLEAMASGAVVMASKTAANDAMLAGGRGITIDPLDIEDVVSKLTVLIGDDKLRSSTAKIARHYVMDNYDWYKIVERIVGVGTR